MGLVAKMSTVGTYGKLGEYNPDYDDWTQYVKQMEHSFQQMTLKKNPRRKLHYLVLVELKLILLIRSLVATSKPGTKTFKQLVDVMTAHQNPKPSVIMEWYRFNKRDSTRESCESIAQYVAALRKLSEHCEYGETLTDTIRDRLVCGIRDDRIQQQLLAESTLTLENAIKVATSMEQAKKNLEDIHKSRDSEAAVMKVQPRKKSNFSGSCYRCGGGHLSDSCRIRDSECHYCHKRGHIVTKCRKKQADKTFKCPTTFHTYTVKEGSDEEDMNALYEMDYGRTEPIIIEIYSNDIPVVMELGTGASLTVVNENIFNEIKANCGSLKLDPIKIKFRTFTGEIVPALGNESQCSI